MSTNAVSVELRHLIKRFPAYGKNEEFTAVNNVNLTVAPGEMATLLGPSGCGKTTVLRMLSGFEIPTSGSIVLDGRDVTKLPPNKRNVGMMFQSYALFPHLSVYENVAYGLRLKRLPESEIKERVGDVLELMQISEYAKRMPNQISGGQQQRVALARAVVTEPSVLLFDEPLSNLDAKLREYMRDELRKIQQRVGITSVYVTHDQSEAMAISDKVVIMQHGEIEQVGTARGIYAEPVNQFVANFMGKSDFAAAQDVSISGDSADATVLGRRMRLSFSEKCADAKRFVCMVRPEFIRFDDNGEFEAQIRQSIYLGQIVQYELTIGSESFTMIDYMHNLHGMFADGEVKRITIPEQSLRLLPADDE